MAQPAPKSNSLLSKKRIIFLTVLLLLLYFVAPRLDGFTESLAVTRHARIPLVLLAAAMLAVTYLWAAAMYWALAIKPLRYRPTLLVQVASGFTNRLLPAGLGTLTLFVQYLRRQHHSLSQAVTITGAGSLVGVVGHMCILALVLLITQDVYPARVALPSPGTVWLVVVLVIGVIAANLLVFRRLRQFAYRFTREVFAAAWEYRRRPLRLLAAFASSLLLTCTYVGVFYVCMVALGAHLSLGHVFLVFTIGMIAATATPTPGGLVGAEAGLTGGLIAYGIHPDTALAVALLYRFLTYWLPLLPGLVVFMRIRKLYSK